MGGRGTSTADVESGIFYANDGMVASTDPGWIQLTFDLLAGLLDRMGLRTNICKTVGMVSRPFWAAGVRSDKAYTQRMRGGGRSFKEHQRKRKRQRVSYPECGKELGKWSLVTHCQTQHGVAKGRLGLEGYNADKGVNDPRNYSMAFPERAGPRTCPVKRRSCQASM